MFPAWHQTDLTIIIPDPKMQHKGYGTEAIRIMLDMAFNKYEMHRVSIGVVELNTDALEFYKKNRIQAGRYSGRGILLQQ